MMKKPKRQINRQKGNKLTKDCWAFAERHLKTTPRGMYISLSICIVNLVRMTFKRRRPHTDLQPRVEERFIHRESFPHLHLKKENIFVILTK